MTDELEDLPAFRWRAPRWGRHRTGRAVLAAAVLALPVAAGVGAGAPDAAAQAPASVAPAVDAARARLDAARVRLDIARARLTELEWEAVGIEAERGSLDAEQQQLSRDLEDARVRAREAMVAAYIGGRPADLTAILLTTESATDLAFRTELLTRHVEQRTATVREYSSLEEEITGTTEELAERAASNRIARDQAVAEIAAAESEAAQAAVDLEVAEAQALIARAEAAEEAARRSGAGRPFKAAGSDGSPTPAESGNAFGLAWDLLRRCESGGNYAAVNPTGNFRGAYQFHQTTWEMLGGVGDPIDATTAEQDYRAQLLYDMLGAKPWPQCGRYLKMTEEQLQAIVSGIPPTTAPVPAAAAESSTTTSSVGSPSSSTTVPASASSTTSSSAVVRGDG